MSGSTGTIEAPTGDDGALDDSVTELLGLLGGPGAQQPARPKAGWTQATMPSGPRGGMSEDDYNKLLNAAMPAITAARALPAITTKAQPAVDRLEDEINSAATLGGQKSYAMAASALRRATEQARAATTATGEEFTRLHAAAVKALGTRPARIANLVPQVGAVTTALGTATTARDAATTASTGNPADWTTAFTKVGEMQAAIAPLDAACLSAAQAVEADLLQRYNVVNGRKPVGRDIVSKFSDCNAARKRLGTLVARADGLGALESGPGAEAAMAALETAANPSGAARQQKINEAMGTLTGLKDKEVKGLPLLDKALLAFDLCSNRLPTDQATLDQLDRLYRNSPPDKQFLKKREKQRKEIADKVAKMPEIAELYDKKGKFNAAKWKTFIKDPAKVKALLENVSHAQADALGIPHIPINMAPDPPEGTQPDGSLSFGGYSPSTDSIDLNMHEDCLDPADEALGTILHEMFHAHQDFLVRQLKDGQIGPNDPDYATAMMYMVNDIPVGYLFPPDDGDVDGPKKQKAYEAQPTEIDAEVEGKGAALDVLKQAMKNAKSKK